MIKIIRADFDQQDYVQLVKEFLHTNTHISPTHSVLQKTETDLLTLAPSFVQLSLPFFESTGNARFDEMVKRMEIFITTLSRLVRQAEGSSQPFLRSFWQQISEMLETDYKQIQDPYLGNTYRYFIHALRKIADPSSPEKTKV